MRNVVLSSLDPEITIDGERYQLPRFRFSGPPPGQTLAKLLLEEPAWPASHEHGVPLDHLDPKGFVP